MCNANMVRYLRWFENLAWRGVGTIFCVFRLIFFCYIYLLDNVVEVLCGW